MQIGFNCQGPTTLLFEKLNVNNGLTSVLHGCLQAFVQQHGARPIQDALDVGCSAGLSTRALAEAFPAASLTGLDLSPHFLAVAEYRERCARQALRLQHLHFACKNEQMSSAQ